MAPTIQGLGTMDIELAVFDAHLVAGFDALDDMSDDKKVAHAQLLTRHITHSYLWVLGAYEIVRSIAQRYFEGDRKAPDLLGIKEVKNQFARLRMPLAKYEAAKASSEDSPIAYPAFNRDKGVAWQIGAELFVTREELADALLNLLEHMPPHAERPRRSE